ncbi:MAG: cupredoxin domain-containing protein [Thermoplasmata archaeon]|nr:cupredoxin domain-containing protein [Thermoplasmata archaeon]
MTSTTSRDPPVAQGTSAGPATVSRTESLDPERRSHHAMRRLVVGAQLRLPRAFEGALLISLVGLVLAAFVCPPAVAPSRGTGVTPAVMPGPSLPVAVDYVNVSTTSMYAFVPNQFTVTPGAVVHLMVTQEANFAHTFLLSSAVNFTFPSSDTTTDLVAYFHTHVPLVNLTLGSTVGLRAYANFTAPAAGTYEFVCVVDGHFTSGMTGVMTSGSAVVPPPYALPWTLLVVAAVVIVGAAGATLAVLRRRKTPPIPPQDRA